MSKWSETKVDNFNSVNFFKVDNFTKIDNSYAVNLFRPKLTKSVQSTLFLSTFVKNCCWNILTGKKIDFWSKLTTTSIQSTFSSRLEVHGCPSRFRSEYFSVDFKIDFSQVDNHLRSFWRDKDLKTKKKWQDGLWRAEHIFGRADNNFWRADYVFWGGGYSRFLERPKPNNLYKRSSQAWFS